MEKFCSNCGSPLKEGKNCNCQKNKKENITKNKDTLKSYYDLFIEIVKGIFSKPIDTIKKYSTSKNYLFSLCAILINSIFSGILAYCFVKEGITSFIGLGALHLGYIEISFLETVLQTTLFMTIFFISTASIIYILTSSLFKSKIEFKEVISLVGVCSIFTLVTSIAIIVFTFISIKLALMAFLIADTFYLAYLYQGISEISTLNKNNIAYVFVPAILIANFIVIYILPKILF